MDAFLGRKWNSDVQMLYARKSASMGIRALLKEIGVSYELAQTTIDMDRPRPPEQLAINPNGWVLVPVWDGGSMYECSAITVFHCDRHPEAGLAPVLDDTTRAQCLQILVYISNSVQNAFQLIYYPDRFADTAANERNAQRRGNRRLRETWNVVDDQIGVNEWMLGKRFSAVDIYLFMLTTWLKSAKGHPAIDEFPTSNVVPMRLCRGQAFNLSTIPGSRIRSTEHGVHPVRLDVRIRHPRWPVRQGRHCEVRGARRLTCAS